MSGPAKPLDSFRKIVVSSSQSPYKRPVIDPSFPAWIQEHIFSPTELEAFLDCPFRFYAQAYLKLTPETEWEVEMTPMEMGRILHRILEKFLRNPKKEEAYLLSLMEEELAAHKKDRPHLSPVLLEHQKKRIVRTLLAFLKQDLFEGAEAKTLKPEYLEWSFGKKTPPLEIGDGIKIQGRIDRIDVDRKNKQFLIIDYKTGSTEITGSQILKGNSLQLPIYVMAVKQLLLPDFEPIGGIYYHLSDMTRKNGILHAERAAESLPDLLEIGSRSSSLVPGAKWENAFEKIEERIQEIVREIRKGAFPSHSEPCDRYCPYQDLCRIRAAGENR